MKPTAAVGVLGSAAFLACWCGAAQAYRPFDGTDAAVADLGGMAIELGPVEGVERALFAPNARINYGFTPGWEAVLEGIIVHRLTATLPGTSLVENGVFLKGVLREGALRTTGPYGPLRKSSTIAMLRSFAPAPLWSGRSGRCKTTSPSTSGCAEPASITIPRGRSAPASPSPLG
jgi:hypothetical protein